METPSLAPQPSPPEFNLNDLTNLSDEQVDFLEEPTTALLTLDVTKMNYGELAAHVARLHSMRAGIDGVKTLLRAEAESIRERKPRAPKKDKLDISRLL